ncbi:MAG: spore coat protein U domain-containing protein [Deltaproteobacteria bacterium]|nr:spore coat protein U domain-containing protein [Deltaproteobacteria bacterium]
MAKFSVKTFVFALFLILFAGEALALCTVTTTAVNFGAYDVFVTTPTDSAGSITVSCDVNTVVTVQIGISPTSGSFNPRQMKHSILPDLLNYNVFTNAARTRIWGDGTGGTWVQTRLIRPGMPRTWSAFGRIVAGQDVTVGNYTDTLTVTVLP